MFLNKMIVQKVNRKINNYKHGPLARSVIGQQQVQGLDYAYTLEGWLKGVSSTTLQSAAGRGVLTMRMEIMDYYFYIL
jgi:hypothetical protein